MKLDHKHNEYAQDEFLYLFLTLVSAESKTRSFTRTHKHIPTYELELVKDAD